MNPFRRTRKPSAHRLVGRPRGWMTGALLIAMLGAACAPVDTASEPKDTAGDGGSAKPESDANEARMGGTLRVGRPSDPSTLDPHFSTAGADHTFLYALYDGLVGFDLETLEPVPGLAESWELLDDTTLVLQLRDGVQFHDGTPLNAEAVKFNIERSLNDERSTGRADVGNIESVEVVDDLSVRINLVRPDSALLLILSDRVGMMVSPSAVGEQGGTVERAPVGTGPFKFVEWTPGDRVVVERNPDYWRDDVYLDGIQFIVLSDVDARVNALVSGQVDVVDEVSALDIDFLKSADGLEVKFGPSLQYQKWFMNQGRPPLNDPAVRHAINVAIDREALNETLQGGYGEVAWMPFPSTHWAYQPDLVPSYDFDPELARKLLAEAGYQDGVTINAAVFANSTAIRRAELIQAQLAEVGITLEITSMELIAAVRGFLDDFTFDALLSEWTGRIEPNQTLALQLRENARFNPGRNRVERVEALLDEAVSYYELEERKRVYQDLMEVIIEESLEIPLFFEPSVLAHDERVQGLILTLQKGKTQYRGVWING